MNKVVTRFVPDINGRFVMHIGHLTTLFCNLLYAKKYGGNCYVLPSIRRIGPGSHTEMRDTIQWEKMYPMRCHGTACFQMLGIVEEDMRIIPLFTGGGSIRRDLIDKVKEATGIEITDLQGWKNIIYKGFGGIPYSEALMVAMTDFIMGTNVIIRGRDWHPDMVGTHNPGEFPQGYVNDHFSFLQRFKREAGQDDEIQEYFAPTVTYEGEKVSHSSLSIGDSIVLFRAGGVCTPIGIGSPKLMSSISTISYLAWMMEMFGSSVNGLDDIFKYHEVFDIEKVPDEISFVLDELVDVNERVQQWLPDEAFLETMGEPGESQQLKGWRLQVTLFREALGINPT